MIDERLQSLMVCPAGRRPLNLLGDYLVCRNCGVKFPVVEGIPVLIIEEAELPDGCQLGSALKCFAEGGRIGG